MFSMAKFAKGNNTKNIFFKVSPVNPFIILYQLTMFEAHSYNNFRNSFQWPNLQRVLTVN